MTDVTKNGRLFAVTPTTCSTLLLALCAFKLLFPPIDIQHTQCPCRFVILETKALWSQASSHMYIYYIYIILRSTSQVRQQDTGHIRSVPMHAASGLFSWSMAFLSRQFAPTIMDLCPLHIICLLYTSPSPRDGLLSRMPSSA